MTSALLIALALSAPAGSSSAVSLDGWRDLKWGMSVPQASEALGSSASFRDISREENGDEQRFIVLRWTDDLADTPVALALAFWKGRLYCVQLRPQFQEGTTLSDQWSWAVRIGQMLSEKYGRPTRDDGWSSGTLGDIVRGKSTPVKAWKAGPTSVELRVIGNDSKFSLSPVLEYAETAAQAEAIDAWVKAREAKRKTEASKL